ncbi:kinase-like protein [Suhomyces tanzawaensis NRRL Y-17324]|uniref:Kinase-like protein n=1 Tax=Suhomyces tanzawaensis NRRL Y-17324 TaxID=984487 RepID=A0A1E4SDC5_9ASCO|nr:kinase-like protein [Suhomyces tanzawaensis NRRL Y-17324]ODV77514.1 kinase-like protein [Suhomyces tanzawaensis NRRL Y-17324]
MMDEYERYDGGELLRNRYLKVGDISEGSYGLVSVAKDTKEGDRFVAVKFIYPVDYKKTKKSSRPSSSPVRLRSTTEKPSEASIWKSLYDEAQKEIKIHNILGTHPNISSLYDHFDSCLVLEYCSRGDLYEAIHNGKGPSTSQDIKDVFHQVLNALEFCHSHSVYHRDLKPENILITEDWSIKLCDWGLATTTKIITNRAEFDIGSERYMAPELFDDEIESYDASKIDIWSVGIILLTLVFHKNPFQVANYSDKRFLQFVGNREALFDIFSTMSGDMFSVLRFCLNIDPTNRDLASLRTELNSLKYFTIDEEYWGSDYDEEDELEDEVEARDEDEVFYYKKEPVLSISPVKQAPIITTSDFDAAESPLIEDKQIPSEQVKFRVLVDGPHMPHNHRADALLSSNTSLKPIPIGGSNFRNIRNTRKPFTVASYNQSSQNNGRFGNNKFNREDFFTPKSVFNHYMDKYGEQRFGNSNQNGSHQRHGGSRNLDSRTKGRKPRSWKKAYKKGKPRDKNLNVNRHHNGHDYSHQTGYDTNRQTSRHGGNRRKSRLFSTGKQQKIPTSNSNTIASTFHNLSHPASNMISSVNSSTGKYIPPYLRSPTFTKSPVVAPLTEEIDNLSLSNDYDEVFHLEDDFDLGGSKPEPPSSGIQFKKPNFRGLNSTTPDSMSDASIRNGMMSIHQNIVPNQGLNGSHGNGRRNSVLSGNRRPISVGSNAFNDTSSSLGSCSAGGKYIPPFRRGSQSKPKPEKKGIEDLAQKMTNLELNDLNSFKASSVPVNGSFDWLSSYKKDWSDYD